jgi:hypothetical protein
LKYGGGVIIGGLQGSYLEKLGMIPTVLTAGVFSAGENIILDGSIAPAEIGANMLGAGAGKLTGTAMSTPAIVNNISPLATDVLQSATEFVTTVKTYDSLNGSNNKRQDGKSK